MISIYACQFFIFSSLYQRYFTLFIMMASSCLPSELIMLEILPWLPVKTLCKFRCVSKSWYALLSDPNFLQLHCRRSERNPTLLVIAPKYKETRIPFFTMNKSKDQGRRRWLKDSTAYLRFDMWPYFSKASTCHGLVCMYNRTTMCIWNPATGERIGVEHPVRDAFACYVEREIVAAIGYAESTRECKVLVFHPHPSVLSDVFCEVLTMGSGEWRDAKGPPFALSFLAYGSCNVAFVNGFFHVLPAEACSGGGLLGIARFDLEREDWSVMPGVDPCRLAGPYKPCLSLLREVTGVLCFVQFSGCRSRADIWLLKDYDKGVWAKEYTIENPYLTSVWKRSFSSLPQPLTTEEDGRILFATRNLLFDYDPKSESFEEIYKDGNFFIATMYVESFSTLKR